MSILEELKQHIVDLKKDRGSLEKELKIKASILYGMEENLYNMELRYVYIKRIFRLASIHFTRLRGEREDRLTPADIQELEKWIGRAKSTDGLKDIISALSELKKYYPKDIKSNLYGLVQKIIIEGPIKRK